MHTGLGRPFISNLETGKKNLASVPWKYSLLRLTSRWPGLCVAFDTASYRLFCLPSVIRDRSSAKTSRTTRNKFRTSGLRMSLR